MSTMEWLGIGCVVVGVLLLWLSCWLWPETSDKKPQIDE
jgi:hypothetical protein